MKKIVVGIGEALWDMLPEGRKIGGAPANFAYHAGQFGMDSRVVSAIGKDRLGDEIITNFADKKLPMHIETVPYDTGTVSVSLDGYGVPHYDIKKEVAWDYIPFTPVLKELASQTSAVCFGSLAQRNVVSRETIHQFLDIMPDDAGQLKIFDINLRQHFYNEDILSLSFRKCNVLKINDDELDTINRLFGNPGMDVQSQCRHLLAEYKLKILILTCGVNGSYVFTLDNVSYKDTPNVAVADTVGAGDSFTGAFCAALLKGKDIPFAHQLAVEVSAYVCTQHGAMAEIPEKFKTF